jgi:hypothetical protein
MTGLPDFNRPAFFEAQDKLEAAGYAVINPARNGLPPDAPWEQHMREDIANMVQLAEAVATLPGIEASRGSQIEVGLALRLGWRVLPVDVWLEDAREKQEAAQ